MNLREGDTLIQVRMVRDDDEEILMATDRGKAIRFRVSDVRPMGRVAAGVKGITLPKGDTVIGADAVGPEGKVLLVSAYGYGKMTDVSDFPLHRRGGSGVIAMKTGEKSGPLAVMRIITREDEILLLTAEGTAIRTLISQIKVLRRASLGVRLMKVEPPDRLVACSVFEGD